jgi:hypothetical protein
MFQMFALAISLGIGFAGGYGVREWISRRRHAAAREEYFRKLEENLSDSERRLLGTWR